MRPFVLALNPSIDAEWRLTRVLPEEKNEVLSERRWPGGKGVNVARWLRHLGAPARLLLPLGGHTGQELARQLRTERLTASILWLDQPTRVNVIVTPSQGPQLRFNPVWLRLRDADWRRLWRAIRRLLPQAACVVLSGSLPRGVPVDTYARSIRAATTAGVRSVLDCDGAALAAGVSARPFLVKPNEHELAQWLGRGLDSDQALIEAARQLSALTAGWVLVSRGERGALLVHRGLGLTLTAVPPRVNVANTVGAGDALLAAVTMQLSRGAAPPEWLRWGVATGSVAVGCAAGQLPRAGAIRALAQRVQVEVR